MSERETTRFVAWAQEMREVHARLRAALRLTLESDDLAVDDLLLYCRGFCSALDGHHRGEDRTLFPAIAAAHPDLRPVLRKLEQDHSMIDHLLGGLRAAAERSAGPEELERHLEGVGAIMENHFRYEERMLLTVLESLDLHVSPQEALGPL
ncbi:hemerythrin domain-containing protein [Actinoplanes sp. CA-252034]|uniref:hemerythrin domain-containing protein n=1 Tax=Actinoplanes sp. CA-252034 TaxID=3239906 RepID=UPI003D965EDD